MHFNEFSKRLVSYLKSFVSIIFWLLLIFAFTTPAEGCITVLSAVVHESGHFLYTWLFVKSPSMPYGSLSGLRIRKPFVLSYGEEIMLYLSGPLANLAFAFMLLPCFLFSYDFARDFLVINIFTMLSNLLPVEGYDGYGVILAVAANCGMEQIARRILSCVSFFFTLLMLFISLYLMYYLNGGYWIFAVFSVSALSFIKKSLKSQKRSFREI